MTNSSSKRQEINAQIEEVGCYVSLPEVVTFFLEENHATEVKNGDAKVRRFFDYQALARFVTVDYETKVLVLL